MEAVAHTFLGLFDQCQLCLEDAVCQDFNLTSFGIQSHQDIFKSGEGMHTFEQDHKDSHLRVFPRLFRVIQRFFRFCIDLITGIVGDDQIFEPGK